MLFPRFKSAKHKQPQPSTPFEFRKDHLNSLSKKELKKSKIDAPHYHPTGGEFPKQGNSPAEVRENVQYLETEVGRWHESLAWVADNVTVRNDVVSHSSRNIQCCEKRPIAHCTRISRSLDR